jgi:hypothetical protein
MFKVQGKRGWFKFKPFKRFAPENVQADMFLYAITEHEYDH